MVIFFKSLPRFANWTPPLLVAAALLAVQAVCTQPGELIADSREQLHQAIAQQYSDWHPPVMALVWSWLIRLGGSSGSLLALHQFLHWLGIGLIADGCFRSGRRREAWLVLAAGAYPLFLFYDRIVVKDVAMASAFVAATGLSAWFIIQGKRVPPWAVLLSGFCTLYGALTRTNAVFAIGPLLLLSIPRARQQSLPKIVAFCVVAAAAAVPLANWINHELIGARPEYPIQSLQLFDLMGIAVHAGDNRVMGEHPPPMSEIRGCYTPYWWDPVSPWGSCPRLRLELGYTLDLDTTDPATVSRTAELWRAAIRKYPMAYLAHRAQYFNSSLYFVVPALHFRYAKAADLAPLGTRTISQRDVRLDYLKNNFFCWPVVWLYLGVCVLILLEFSAQVRTTTLIARLLIVSGLLFAGAYLLIGVATEFRYYYWSIMAILLGAILAWREIVDANRSRRWPTRLVVAGLLVIIVVGLAARIADVPFV